MGVTRLCLFAAGNDPEIIERDRMGTQERSEEWKGKEGLGSGALGLREKERSSGPSL